MKYKYEKFIDDKMSDISKEKVILDVGGGALFTKWLSKYEPLFKNCDYQTLDYDNSTNPSVVGDIHEIPLKNESVDGVICSSVLEHVANPILATQEMWRILKPGGKIFVYVPSIYPYHARKGHYLDYWRIFDDTIAVLFKDFSKVEFVKSGGYFKALFFFVPMQNRLQFVLKPLAWFLDFIFKTERRNTTAGYYIYAIK